MIEMPDPANVKRLIDECDEIFKGQPTTDVYNALVNLLGYSLHQCNEPERQLMQAIQAIATLARIRFQVHKSDDGDEELEFDDDREQQSTH